MTHGSGGGGIFDTSEPKPKRKDAAASFEVGKLFDKLPPNAPEAEMALLGSMLIDPSVIPGVIDFVQSPEAFYKESHGAIFKSVVGLYDKTQAVDLVQVVEILRGLGVLDRIGGERYLVELAEGVPSAVNAPYYAKIIADKHRLRQLIRVSGQTLYDAYHAGELGPEGVREVVDKAQAMLFEVADQPGRHDAETLEQILLAEEHRIQSLDGRTVTGVATGYDDMDRLTSGFQQGEMIIVAARPSMGKTALALNIAEQVAMGASPHGPRFGERVPVVFFSLEMSKQALAQRLISAHSGVDLQHIRSGGLAAQERDHVTEACESLYGLPIFVDDQPAMTVLQLRARSRRLVAQHGIKCIFIDYLQLLTSPAAARESRQMEVATISRGIKALARELSVPVVCLAQLNRGTEQREGNRPRMSDLRESGSIEQDADVVMLLHREEYYHRNDPDWMDENPDKANLAELIIAKQRNGPTGIVKMTWDSRTTRFKNHNPFDEDPGAHGGGWGAPSNEPPGPGAWGQGLGATTRGMGGGGAPGARPGGFAPGNRTGPIDNHRDGGGPEHEFDDEGEFEEPPF